MASQSSPEQGAAFHFILGPSLEAVGGCERKAIRSELIRRRCLQKKLRYQQEQMVKLDQLLKGSSSGLLKTTDAYYPPNETSPLSTPDALEFADTPALTHGKGSPSSDPDPDTPTALLVSSDVSTNCLSCGGDMMCTELKDLFLGSYCICDMSAGIDGAGFEIDPPDLYPISTRWYMPLLLDYFKENIAFTTMSVPRDGLACGLQTTWLSNALKDECAFHATLYAASAHIDMTRRKASLITLSHETKILPLVHSRLSNSQSAFDDGTLAAIVALASFSPFTLKLESSQAHMNYLLYMVNARGGLSALGPDSLQAGLIQQASLTFAVIFDTSPPVELSSHTPTLPNSLLSAIIKQGNSLTSVSGPYPTTAVMFQDICSAIALLIKAQEGLMNNDTMHWIIQKGRLEADRKFHTSENDKNLILEANDHINRACQLASVVFWMILDEEAQSGPGSSLGGYLRDLENTVAAVDRMLWLRTAPTIYSWVCLTAAAAAREMDQRAWFYFQQGHRVLVTGERERMMQECWVYFSWLRRLRKMRD